jgi:hypothetical protein
MNEFKFVASAFAALALSSLSLPAQASVTFAISGFSTSCSVLGPTPNQPELHLRKTMNSLGPCDVVITVSGMAAGGFADFTISEEVVNRTGLKWHDFHHTLGYGRDAGFKESMETDEVYFRDNFLHTGDRFSLSGQDDPLQPDTLDWLVSGADFPSSGLTDNKFKLGVHIQDVDAMGMADSDGSTTFTLRQRATIVPEPSALSLYLLVSGAALLAGRRRP